MNASSIFTTTFWFNLLIIFYIYLGPLASLDSINLGFLRCANESGPADYPDYEIYINELAGSFTTDLGLKPEVLSNCLFTISLSLRNVRWQSIDTSYVSASITSNEITNQKYIWLNS